MYLEAKVQIAKVDNFFGGLELIVLDRGVDKRPKYTVRLVRGWPGLDELRELKKNNATVEQLTDYAMKIQLPKEDQVLPLNVLDITGKGNFRTLLAEVMPQTA